MLKDITYINVPYDLDGPGRVIVRGYWPEFQRQDWLSALKDFKPQAEPYAPTFLTATIATDNGRGGMIVQGIDPGPRESFHSFFATVETAKQMSTRYGNGEVVELPSPFAGGGPVVQIPTTSWGIVLADGRTFNAGMIASYFVRNNEVDTPGVADRLIKAALGL